MHAKKQTFILILFLIFTLGSIYYSLKLDFNIGDDEDKQSSQTIDQKSYFSNIFYYVTKNNSKSLYLKGDELETSSESGNAIISKVNGTRFQEQKDPLHFLGNEGHFYKSQGKMDLLGEAKVQTKSSVVFADEIYFKHEKNEFDGMGNVKSERVDQVSKDIIKINSETVSYSGETGLIHYHGSVKGKIQKNKVYEPPTYFWSKELKGHENESLIELLGQVKIKKQGLVANSLKGEIYLHKLNKKLKNFVLFDDIEVVERVNPGNGKPPFTRKAFGERLDGHSLDNKLILTGSPRVVQKDEIIRGNKITLYQNNEVVEVDYANTKLIVEKENKSNQNNEQLDEEKEE